MKIKFVHLAFQIKRGADGARRDIQASSVREMSLTIMNTKLMVIKMLAMATTVWSAEIAKVMAVAV